MKKPLDKIYEAYYDSMGENFGRKVRERIHWICENVKGNNILDIGCSQGITSIILGREGKTVFGIDLLNESIEFAKSSLENEEESTRNNVRFETANFMNYDFKDEKYDSILITEVLEHLTDPKSFIQKAEKYLVDQGRIIISVPFGINDYFDHKKTYYAYDLLELVKDNFEVCEIKIMGKWIGIVVKKGIFNIDYKEQLKKLEDGFYNLERELLEVDKRSKEKIEINYKNYTSSNEKLIECNNKYKEITSNVISLKSQLKDQEEKINNLNSELENALEKNDILEVKVKELEENIIQTVQLEELEKQNLELKSVNEKILIENLHFIEQERKILKELEIERDLKITENSDLKNRLEDALEKNDILEVKVKELEENIIQTVQLEELEKQNLELKSENEKILNESLDFIEQERRILKELEAERKLQNDKLEKYKKELESEKKLLQIKLEKSESDRQKFKEKLENLYIVHRNLNNKYKLLFNSKLGKVVRKYRKVRNNLKGNS